MCGPLLLLLIGVPALEIYVLIEVGRWLGTFETVLLVGAMFVLGVGVFRGQSRSALARLQRGMGPNPDALAGPLVLIAGALLMLPGLVTDLIAIPLLFPPSRRLVAHLIVRRYGRPLVPRAGTHHDAPP